METETYRPARLILLGEGASLELRRSTPCTCSPTGRTAWAWAAVLARPSSGPRWRKPGSTNRCDHVSPEEYLDVFFARSDSSRQAGQAALKRMHARNQDRDTATNDAAHGFLFQHHAEFAADVEAFLSAPR
jgi:hypothetical protein